MPAERIPAAPAERGALWRAELAGRRVLAVLDNALDAEHVRPLLPGHSETLVLVTSRRRLVDLDGAHVLSVDSLGQEDAAGLFGRIVGERAHREPDAVREVLRLCGHLPLAIRISAARLQHRPRWSVSYLAGRLRDHRRLLDGVSAAFTLSYEHLREDERRMFRLLGLVPGRDIDPCGAAALAGISQEEAEELLEGLLDAHMLLQLEPGRYTFHDLLREHARSIAEDDGAVMRLLAYYLHRSRAAMDRLFPDSVGHREGIPQPAAPVAPIRDAAEANAWLDAERSNIIATAVHGPEICLGFLALTMRPFLDRRAHHDDALTLHTLALQRSRELGDRAVQARAWTARSPSSRLRCSARVCRVSASSWWARRSRKGRIVRARKPRQISGPWTAVAMMLERSASSQAFASAASRMGATGRGRLGACPPDGRRCRERAGPSPRGSGAGSRRAAA
ncbi:NB-ARC domain-containing protein [Streptosporangium vulgare]|uniref:NB-ARC domain-containing protein n=1 Tax=Streptosporangium vulgare TaxID=46190 RepID=UPI0031DCACE6